MYFVLFSIFRLLTLFLDNFLGVKLIWIVSTRVNIYGVAICLFV